MSRLKKVEFECEVITPLFTRGADGNRPEFRVAPFKAEMRFWLRAILGGIMNQNHREVLKVEQLFFGGSGENAFQSPIQMQLLGDGFNSVQENILPHKFGGHANSIPKGVKFKLVLKTLSKTLEIKYFSVVNNRPHIDTINSSDLFEISKKLFLLSSLIGSTGLRSKRGFGSFQVNCIKFDTTHVNLNFTRIEDYKTKVYELLNEIKSNLMSLINATSLRNKLQETNLRNETSNWPLISNNTFMLFVGKCDKSQNETMKTVMNTIHNKYRPSVYGQAKNGRQGSPLKITFKKLNESLIIVMTLFKTKTIKNPSIEDYNQVVNLIKQFAPTEVSL